MLTAGGVAIVSEGVLKDLQRHPLFERGLGFYGVFRVDRSAWATGTASHFIVTLHDSTFECVAERLTAREVRAPLGDAAADAARWLGGQQD
jgi:hypothetical protein